MMSEEEKKLREEAKTCNDCICWLKHCKAECCKIVYLLNVDPKELKAPGRYIDFRRHLNMNERWYYKLHGIRYIHGIIRIEKDKCRFIGGRVIYLRNCDLLTEDNRCKGHPDKKPFICKYLTLETVHREMVSGQCLSVTPNCLFRFKEVDEDDKAEKTENK